MIDHFDSDVNNIVFVSTYDRSNAIVKTHSDVIIEECFKRWDRLFYYYKQKKIVKALKNKIDVRRVDCIHAYTLFTDGNVAMQLSKQFNKPYVVAVRNTDVNVFFKYMVHLRKQGVEVLKNAKAVFFLSPCYKKNVIEKYVPLNLRDEINNKSIVIPNGIDDFWLKNRSNKNTVSTEKRIKEKKEINCIYVGSIDANKNVELTLKALDVLNNNGWNCTLTAIGRIDNKKVFRRLSCYSFFEYIEPKEKEDLIEYYRKSDIFVMPSHTETFGLVYAEAMSQGLPILYTENQGFDKQFKEGVVGYRVSDKNHHILANKLLMIVHDYEIISRRCVEEIKRFNWEEICEHYQSIYREIIL